MGAQNFSRSVGRFRRVTHQCHVAGPRIDRRDRSHFGPWGTHQPERLDVVQAHRAPDSDTYLVGLAAARPAHAVPPDQAPILVDRFRWHGVTDFRDTAVARFATFCERLPGSHAIADARDT